MNWIETASGDVFDLDHPEDHVYKVDDIAHSLALQCRFNGHCSKFYSVASHSVHVARLQSTMRAYRIGLLHDASEAYLGDCVKPLKTLLPYYRRLETEVSNAIYQQLLGYIPTEADMDPIHAADLAVLACECQELMPSQGKGWDALKGVTPAPIELHCHPWELAESWWLYCWTRSGWQ
jgi:uncharacterized protein